MRAFRFLNLAILSILVVGSALYAQDEKQQEEKPPRQEEPKGHEQGKPASRQDEMKPPRQEEPRGQEAGKPASRQDEMKAPRQEEAKPEKQDKQQQKREQQQSREQMNNGRQEPMPQQEEHARPAGKGGHIPDDKFRSSFGRGHAFKVQRPVAVEGGQGFVYGGYSFVLVDAWPPDWAYTDDCYVDYIDGEYWLFDLFHPGVRIALMVVM